MVAFFNSLSASSIVAIAAMIPAAEAHMSMFHPSMYGFNRGDQQTVWPLSGKSFEQWWFRNTLSDPPKETMTLKAGSTQTVEIACGKHISSWGSSPNKAACPNDQGSYHAGGKTGDSGGWGANQESSLMGCALAIAYKSDARSVKPEDFIVMSVQEDCVKQRDTPFAIPKNLPACPEGGCTCAWFWQGQNSAEEMYMTGFKCDVEGGVQGAKIPKPRKPQQKGNSDTATQPFYWANNGGQNVDWEVGWTTRPKYNSKMGWTNGAQTRAFEGAGGSVNPPPPGPKSTSSTKTKAANPSTNTDAANGPDFPVHAADPHHPSDTPSPAAGTNTPNPGQQPGCKKKVRRRRNIAGRSAHHAANARRH